MTSELVNLVSEIILQLTGSNDIKVPSTEWKNEKKADKKIGPTIKGA